MYLIEPKKKKKKKLALCTQLFDVADVPYINQSLRVRSFWGGDVILGHLVPFGGGQLQRLRNEPKIANSLVIWVNGCFCPELRLFSDALYSK